MVRLRFETDLATSLKASNDLAKATDKIADSYDKTARGAKQLEAAAKRIVDQNLTPQEKYNQKLETMAKAVKAGKLSMEDAARAAERMRMKLDDAGNSSRKVFGADGIQNLAGFAQGFVGISAAISAVSLGLRQMEADAQQSADRVFSSIGAFGELQQVATSPEDYLKLIGQARSLQSRGVFGPDQGAQAADFVFALRNAGYSDSDVAFITQLGESKQVKPENMQKVAEGLKKFQNIFGKEEAGDVRAVAQKVFQAAGAMQTDFAPAAEASTLFGSEAAALKFSDEEALAAFVAIEQQSPGAEEAATRLRSMLTQIQKKKLSTGTMTETMGTLAERVRKGESAIDIMGETRAAAGLNILAKPGTFDVFQQQTKLIGEAQSTDLIGRRRFLESDPRLRAAARKQVAEGSQAEAQAKLTSEIENLFDAYRAEEKTYFLNRGDREGATFSGMMLGITDALGNERGALENALGNNRITPELRAGIEDYLRRLAESNERMETQLTAPRPSGRQEQ